MALYTNQTGKLKEVKEKPFKLEKDIQKVFEENLSAIMVDILDYVDPGNSENLNFRKALYSS